MRGDAAAFRLEVCRRSLGLSPELTSSLWLFSGGATTDLTRFNEANRRGIEAGREWQYAVGMLASHHRVSVPRWFLRANCKLAKGG